MNAITRRIRGGRGGGRHAAAGSVGSVADRGTDPDEASVTDRLRQLQLLGAEQIRVAAELESAARAQRLAAQELHQGIDALLASWARHTGTASAPAAAADACRGPPRRMRRPAWCPCRPPRDQRHPRPRWPPACSGRWT
jgi:hypothetical protein